MRLIPAIDLLDGRCVRLRHGDFNACTFYERDPHLLARHYLEHGAQWLHVVDLAAARDGEAADTGPLFRFLKSAGQQVQTGGGVRNRGDIEARLEAGASRVVIGSECASQPVRFARWLGEFGSGALVAALDVELDPDGVAWPRIHGWTEDAGRTLDDLLEELIPAGLQHLLCTDIGRDGAMSGPNVELYRALAERYPGIKIQASGGVANLDDLVQLQQTGAAAAITGKALLEGSFSVSVAFDVLA